MYSWANDLFPICRSITGPGVRDTLLYIKNIIDDIRIHEVPTGKKVFDWTVPKEWSVNEAWIETAEAIKLSTLKTIIFIW